MKDAFPCSIRELEIFAQANNQWNIGADLGNDPMDSAFARTLTAGIKGVAMVLDQEVQPLTSDSTKCGACQEVQGFSCHVLVIITLFSLFLHFPPKKKDFGAEEFGVCSNFCCPAGSTWSWFSSPTLV